MATETKVEHGTQHTPLEIIEFTSRQQRIEQYKQAAKNALQLLDLQNPPTKSYTVYSKETLRTYLKNPLSEQNQKNLRNVSQFLYHLSAQYKRIIAYFASQVDLTGYNVIPNVSMTEDNDAESVLSNYEQTLRWIEKMNLAGQIFSMLVTAWREDVFYGYIYYDDSGEQDVNSFVVMPLDGNYCRVSSVNYDGTLNVAFDFSYFSGANSVYLEYWDKEFTTKYNSYQNDSQLRWQELDPERTFCLKVNYDQIDRVIPPFAPLFEGIIDLVDLQSIVSEKDALSIYKLLVAKIDTLSGAKDPNDFEIDLNTAVDFYNKMAAAVPESVGIVLSPMSVEPIEFEKNATEDTNEISKANSNLWEAAGMSQVMDASKLTGASAVRAAMIFDGLYALKPLLAQIEARVNRWLDYVLPNNGMRLKYLGVTPYTKDEWIKTVKDAASLGLPVKLQYASLLGISPLDAFSMAYLENDVLKLHEKWLPLQNSYTQNGVDTGGAPEKDEPLSDEGEKTKDQEKNKS